MKTLCVLPEAMELEGRQFKKFEIDHILGRLAYKANLKPRSMNMELLMSPLDYNHDEICSSLHYCIYYVFKYKNNESFYSLAMWSKAAV